MAFTKTIFQSRANRGAHGNKYEQDLAFVMFVRCTLAKCNFKLATEMEEAGKLDDVVLYFEPPRNEGWLFQAKHGKNSEKQIVHFDLFYADGKDYDLLKYIKSHFYVKQNLQTDCGKIQYFIFTNISMGEIDEPESWVNIFPKKVPELINFAKSGARYVGLKPKEDKIAIIIDTVNKNFHALKNAIIALFKTGVIHEILTQYKKPLSKILKIENNDLKFHENFLDNSGDTIEKELHKQLQAHFQQKSQKMEFISKECNASRNNLLKGKSTNDHLPPLVDEDMVLEFFERLTFCVNQPNDLRTIVDEDLHLWLRSWIKPDDLGKFGEAQLILPRVKFDEVFRKWNEPKMSQDSNEPNDKLFLTYDVGLKCVQDITIELNQYVSKHSEALDRYYVNRFMKIHDKERVFNDKVLLTNLETDFDSNKCSILIAEPGMGKTTLLQYIGFEVQKSSNRDVFLIYFRNLNENLRKVGDGDIKQMISHLFTDVLSNTSLKNFHNILENKGNRILLLCDGFDEIAPSLRLKTATLLNKLHKTRKIQIIISGRKHVQETLEQELTVNVMSLIPFMDTEQMTFLRSFWNIPIALETHEDQRKNKKFELFSNRLLTKFHSDIGREQYSFTGLPLMIRMLAEIHSEKCFMFLESKSDDTQDIFSTEKFSVLKLFEQFVKISFKLTTKKTHGKEAYSTMESPNDDDDLEQPLVEFIVDHQLIAIKQLAVEELQNVPNGEKYSKTNEQLLKRIKKGSEKSLLISFIDEKQPIEFVHLSYAEYFVATYLFHNFNDHLENLFDILRENHVVRRFFFMLIEENFAGNLKQLEIVENMCRTLPDVAFWACEASCVKLVKKILEKHCFRTKVDKNHGSLLHVTVNVQCKELVSHLLYKHNINADIYFELEGTALHVASSRDNVEIAETLINHSANVNVRNGRNETPLHMAAENGRLKIAELLIGNSADVDVQNKFENTPLHFAAKRGQCEIVEMLINRSEKINVQNLNGETPLHLAAANGHLKIVEILIEKSEKIDILETHGNTPLHMAARNGHFEVVQKLVNQKASVDIQNGTKDTPLHLAAANGHLTISKMLIDLSTNLNVQNIRKETPLHMAATNGHPEIVRVLIVQPEDVKVQNETKETPLHLAAKNGHLGIVLMLISELSDVNAQEINGHTPLHMGAKYGHIEISKILISKSDNINVHNIYKETPLHLAVASGHLEIAQLLVHQFATIDVQDINGMSPLHLAAENGHFEIVEMLLKRSASVDVQNATNETPLHLSAKNGQLEIAQLLINHSAQVNAQTDIKNTPLHLAAQNGHLKTAHLLIRHSAFVNAQNQDKKMPLHLAVANKHLDIVRMLVDHSGYENVLHSVENTSLHLAAADGSLEIVINLIDADPENANFLNLFEETPLHMAAANGHSEIVKILTDTIRSNKLVNAQNIFHETPLHVAARHGHLEIVKLLIELSANIEMEDYNGNRSLHMAAENGHLTIVDILINKLANVNASNRFDETPLHLATKCGPLVAGNDHLAIARMLMDKLVNVNARNKLDETPLHMASKCGQLEIANLLIDRSAIVNVENIQKYTPLHYAAKNGHLGIVELLIDKSAHVNAQNIFDETPLNLANKYHHLEIVNILIYVQTIKKYKRNFP